MKKLVQTWTGISLVQRIVAGLVIGALLGMFVPSEGGIAILGDVFVGALKPLHHYWYFSWSSVLYVMQEQATEA